MKVKILSQAMVLASVLTTAPGVVRAQFDFKLMGRPVQVHSFASQGYIDTDANRFLTVRNGGTFAMTDGGVNVSARLTDRFRIGAQAYARRIGELGHGSVTLDWAYGDYRFTDWLGIRAGKVKTVFGLYNDTQDMPFLHTWAILPQSMYSIDLRGNTIAHSGVDLYGSVPVKKVGTFAYTVYGGWRPSDPTGGYYFGALRGAKAVLDRQSGPIMGADLRWTTPLNGVMVGASVMKLDITTDGTRLTNGGQYLIETKKNNTYNYYVTYSLGGLKLDGEYRRQWKVEVPNAGTAVGGGNPVDVRSWYTSAAYRFTKWLELGTYHSRFYSNWAVNRDALNNRMFDQSFTARFDVTKFWNIKVERHFMDGYGAGGTYRGFYTSLNPGGLQPKTNVWIVRAGVNF